jgi:hypothetical protein
MSGHNPNCRQILLVEKVRQFVTEYQHHYNLDQVYGIDIEASLFLFVKECIKEYNEAKPNRN